MRAMRHVFVPIIIIAAHINPALIETKLQRLRDQLICHIISSLGSCQAGMWLRHCVELKINTGPSINHGPRISAGFMPSLMSLALGWLQH